MSRRDALLWAGAAVLSLVAHGLLFFNAGSLAGNQERPQQERQVTSVSFRSVTSPATVPQEAPVETPPKEPELEVTEAPEPPRKPEPPKPEKRAERARQVDTKPEPEQTPQTQQAPTTTVAEKVPEQAMAVSGTVADPAMIEKARQEYLRRLLGHIESNKFYPAAARRRALEAMVKISFELQADGRITNLSVTGGHKILRSAAEEAVERSLPMPKPPPEVVTPLVVNFSMAYQLL